MLQQVAAVGIPWPAIIPSHGVRPLVLFFYDSPMISTKCNSPYYVCVCVCSTESVVCIVLVYCTQHHKRKKRSKQTNSDISQSRT